MGTRIKLTLTREVDGELPEEPYVVGYETLADEENKLLLNKRQYYILIVQKLMQILLDALEKSEDKN